MENIKLNYSCNTLVITVNGHSYAVIQECSRGDVDENKLIAWVEETAFDEDYLCDQYIPCNLDKKHFV